MQTTLRSRQLICTTRSFQTLSCISKPFLKPRISNAGERLVFKRSFETNAFFKGFQDSLNTALETTKGTIFNLMAKNMDEKDVKKFMSHWKDRLEEIPETVPPKDISTPSPPALPLKTPTSPTVKENKAIPSSPYNFDEIFAQKDIELYHPLLGELIVDYGYKKIYSTSVHSLARTPVWKRQRILRPERAILIAEDKIRKGIANSLPGVITVFQDKKTKEIGIVDGQHRVGAMMILSQRGYWKERERNILVEVFPVEKEEEIAVLFRVINAAEPVRLIDLPGNEAGLDDDDLEEESVKKVI
jgi:hypothetical protein